MNTTPRDPKVPIPTVPEDIVLQGTTDKVFELTTIETPIDEVPSILSPLILMLMVLSTLAILMMMGIISLVSLRE